MVSISLCMIVKNETDVLARALASVEPLVDEIVVVDTGSTDDTKEIAKSFTPHVYDFEWIQDFSAARNFAFAKATGDYVMWMDADDVITRENMALWQELKRSLTDDVDVVMGRYNTGFDEEDNPTFFYYRERILRNCAQAYWQGAVHEVVAPFGKIVYTDAAIDHKKTRPSPADRNLNIYEAQRSAGIELSPRDLFYYGRELYYNAEYQVAIDVLEEMIFAEGAWLENQIEACRVQAQCYLMQEQNVEALQALCKSFVFDTPRAEVCCDIGAILLGKQQYQRAAHWYHQALCCELRPDSGAFVTPECYGFIPEIQLCVCYYYLEDFEKAAHHNEKAALYRQDNPKVLQNRKIIAAKK